MSHSAQGVLDFWFGEPGSDGYGKERKEWFVKSDEFDAQIRSRFEPGIQAAIAGELDNWHRAPSRPQETLAYILLLDQFTRNIYRNTPAMVSGDARALAAAQAMVASGQDLAMTPVERVFAYLPYEHSEQIEDQVQSLKLFGLLSDDPFAGGVISYAQKHHDVVARFGRFPHRNDWLGRPSTPEEIEFLKQPGSGF